MDKVSTVLLFRSKLLLYVGGPSQKREREHPSVCDIMFDSGGEDGKWPLMERERDPYEAYNSSQEGLVGIPPL